jgi:hypothetical protein
MFGWQKALPIVLSSICCCVLLTFTFLLLPEYIFTRHAPRFNKAAFYKLKAGDSFSSVTNVLGLPFHFINIPDYAEGTRPGQNFHTNFDQFANFCTAGTNSVFLEYSCQKQDMEFELYKTYEIYISAGKVIEIRSYWHWDW